MGRIYIVAIFDNGKTIIQFIVHMSSNRVRNEVDPLFRHSHLEYISKNLFWTFISIS